MEKGLRKLTEQLFDSTLNQRISRRRALSNLAKITGAAALSFVAGGLIGYSFAPRKEKAITQTKTLTETVYKTETKTVIQSLTSTKTVTKTYTTTKTERPEIKIEVQVGKSYNAATKDYEIGLKVIAPELDSLKAYYENASTSGIIDQWERKTNAYYSSFLTQREIGEQRIRLEVEKDSSRASKEFALNVGLSETEISQSPLNRNSLKILWNDLLEDSELNLDREELFRKEYEIVKDVNLRQAEKATSLYLKQLSTYLISNKKSHENVSKALSLILPLLPSKPWIYNGNFVKSVEKAEFPISEEASYLLAKFLSEIDVDAKHVYAARAMIDQMLTISKWIGVSPFKVLEYEKRKLQLWDLTKELFRKHLKFEARGKRVSVADEKLIERWSERKETNNKHIYLGLRQVQLPSVVVYYDIEKMMYGWNYDEDFPISVYPVGELPTRKSLNLFRKFIEKYDYYNERLNKIVKNPDIKLTFPLTGKKKSPKDLISWILNPKTNKWCERYFPNSSEEAHKDNFQTLFFKGSPESRVPITLYGASIIWNLGYEEGRVESNILFNSYLGQAVFRFLVWYPENTDRGGLGHGEFSFILNKKDEELLYNRNKDELFVEKDYTYSLPFLWTRKKALLKDQEEKGKIKRARIVLPLYDSFYGYGSLDYNFSIN